MADTTHQAKPVAFAERAKKLTVIVASACGIATALSFCGDNMSATAATAAPAPAGGDMSAWSAQETAAFLAALGEAVGEEHVSTDEGE